MYMSQLYTVTNGNIVNLKQINLILFQRKRFAIIIIELNFNKLLLISQNNIVP